MENVNRVLYRPKSLQVIEKMKKDQEVKKKSDIVAKAAEQQQQLVEWRAKVTRQIGLTWRKNLSYYRDR